MEGTMTAPGMVAGRAQRERAESFRDHNRTVFETQRRARRGPTPEIFFTKHLDNSRIVKADDPERRKEMRSFTVAMSILFLLVMTYVWQHFSSIEVGYNIEAKKLQVEKLREENRQLHLTEAQLSDPDRIDRIARQLGLDTPQPGQVVRPDGSFSSSAPVLAEVQVSPAILQ
ncbi:cell division protein FtsL [Terriglobus sp. TAA 43]|uniref:septum formation initiator family protein n=1 Tax=Terriglobus sp. TAA 43 TaxID=278961 RepID=UPI0009FF01A4|nr:cell division protein FtsL [Terriglobus sp. TAA 43]